MGNIFQNNRKVLFITFAILIVLINLAIFSLAVIRINGYRISKASNLYMESQGAENRKKVILLIKSNFLLPTNDKKSNIADIYLSMGDFTKAKPYLKSVNTQEGYLKYTEAALENGNYEAAEEGLSSLSDEELKAELRLFRDITKGESGENVKELPSVPRSNLGKILVILNTGNYNEAPNGTRTGKAILEITGKYPGTKRQTLEVASYFNAWKQPYLSLFTLGKLEAENLNIVDVKIISATSYFLVGNYVKALEAQLMAISINPSDVKLYKTAVSYSELAGNTERTLDLRSNIEYLEKIQSGAFCANCRI